jgi:Zn/Cd-binding protein ZinT
MNAEYADYYEENHAEKDSTTIKEAKKMKLLKKRDGYYLYKVEGFKVLELWKGKEGGKFSYRAGYVSDVDNLDVAIFNAEEEMRSMMREAIS